MTRDEILRRLDAVANATIGGPLPDFLAVPGGWGGPLSELARAAAAEIRCPPVDPASGDHVKHAVWPTDWDGIGLLPKPVK